MIPKFFRLTAWDTTVFAGCVEHEFLGRDRLPIDYVGPVDFMVHETGSTWYDIIATNVGLLLFSERAVQACSDDGIVGMQFCEATIVEIDNSRLRKKPRPNYFWGRPSGLIDVDIEGPLERYIPKKVTPAEGCEWFHINYSRGPSGYVCALQVLESFRRVQISNVFIQPLDYFGISDTKELVAGKPPFRIDLLAKRWPILRIGILKGSLLTQEI